MKRSEYIRFHYKLHFALCNDMHGGKMKYLILVLPLILFPLSTFADSGIIVESAGNVTITNSDGTTLKASSGTEFPDGSKITTGKNSSAVIFFKNGMIKRLAENQNYQNIGTAKKPDTTLFSDLGNAARDMTKPNKGPRAHMMIKKVGPGAKPYAPINKDLAKVDQLNLTTEGKALLKAEVFYKYNRFDSVLKTLTPYCAPKKCRNDAAKSLIRNSYLRLGKADSAKDY